MLRPDGELEALRMLCDRREELTPHRVETVDRLQRLLAELVPGRAKKDLTALQAKANLATVRPHGIAGKTAAGSRPRSLPAWSWSWSKRK